MRAYRPGSSGCPRPQCRVEDYAAERTSHTPTAHWSPGSCCRSFPPVGGAAKGHRAPCVRCRGGAVRAGTNVGWGIQGNSHFGGQAGLVLAAPLFRSAFDAVSGARLRDSMTLQLSPPPTSQDASVADAMGVCGRTISDDTTVDEAVTILDSMPALQHLLVVDQGGRCEGVVTRASLGAFLARSWYSERTPVRDTHHQRGPFAWPGMALALAAEAMRVKRHSVWPVADEDGRLVGVLTLQSVHDALHPVS